MKLFLQSTRPGKEDLRFEILKYDPETKQGVILGSYGVEFPANLEKEYILKTGYKVVREED
jgi:hypothetical protein